MLKCIQIAILLFFIATSYSQGDQLTKNEDEKLKSIAKEIMTEAGLCALITHDSTRQVNVRTMQPFPPDEDLTVWFGTNALSRKVKDIRNNPEITLYYTSPDASGYVVLKGKAFLVSDNELKQKYWMDSWADFYPDRSLYLLIKFVPESLEILSTKNGINGDTKTWQSPSLNLR